MPADYKSFKITRPNPSGALKEELLQVYAPAAGTDAYTTSLDPIHILVEGDPLTLRFANANTGPATVTINAGTPIAIVKFDGTPVASGDIKTDMIATLLFDGVSFRMPAGGGGGSGSSAFDAITSGTNTTALMVVSTGGSLTVTGTGVIEANELKTNTATPVVIDGSAPTHEGQILISQPGNASAAWADPFVQGVYDPLTNADTGGISGGPIKPVLVGGRGSDGKLYDLATDTNGKLSIVGSVSVSGTFPVSDAHYTEEGRADGNNVPLSVDLNGILRTRDFSASTLGDLVSSKRYNQIEINFSEGFDANLITNSSSGGGTFSATTGAGFYATTSAGTADAKGISVSTLNYRPGHEWYAYFTAAFTSPTDAVNTNFQRIGPFSATDGFFIGYEKTTFKFSHRQNSLDTGIARASWNGDQCTGAAGSAFTLLGTPTAIDFTQLNVYRIHGAWFGAAPVILEVFSPDGVWIKLHTYHFPNSLTTPYTYTTNWNLQVEVSKTTSDATNLQVTTACWALGTCDDEFLIKDSITDYTLAAITRSVIAGKKESGAYGNVGLSNEDALNMSGSGAGHVTAATWTTATAGNTALMMVNNSFAYNTVAVQLTGSGTISTGKITFEVSADNTNWVGLVGINVGTGAAMPTADFTLVTGTTALLFNITGFNYFRARLSTTITGAGGQVIISYNVQGLASPNVSTTITTGAITVDSNQGTPNSIGNAWPVYVTDANSHALTVNSTTPSGKYALDQNITSILGTAPTTAGKLDIKSANGDAIVEIGDGTHTVTFMSTTTTAKYGLDINILSILGTAPTTAGKLDVITQADTSILGTTAPSKGLLILGKTCDVTPAYDPIPLSLGGTEVITASAIAGAHRPGYKEQLQVPLSVDLSGFLRVRESAASLLGDLVTSLRYNQVEVNFSQTFDAAVITLSHSGTASDPTQANGQAIVASGTGGTGDGKIVSVGNLSYRPGHEWYAYFTAAFTAPTDTTNTTFQRIGPASPTDGFYIGYELIAGANTFALSSRKASSDTHIKYADFNGDLCNGGAFSAFTQMGTPQAIDFTKINIFRIHGGWFGAAPIALEVFSPDGIWVVMHHIHYPNTLTAPSTATTTYNMFAEVSKTSSDSTNLKIFTPCWALGTCDDLFKISDALTDNTLAKLTRSVLVGHSTAGGGSYVNVKVNPSGALTVAATAAYGDVVTTPPSSTAVSSAAHTVVSTVSVTVLAANANRKEVIITNTGVTVIYLGLGATPTVTDYHIALSGCTNANDGTGSVYVSDIFKGTINAISSGTAGTVVSAELT